MEYYIDPKWLYWCNTLGNLKNLFIGITIFTGVLTIIFLLAFIINFEDLNDTKKVIIILGIICFTSILIAIFLPSKETLIEMQLAQIATKENVQFTVNTLKEIIDYIIMSLK